MKTQWTMPVVLRQAWESFVSRIGFAAMLVALVAAVAGICGFVEADVRQEALDEETRLTVAGQYVYRAQARDENGNGLISAARCQRLNGVQGVRAAMGIGTYRTATILKAPGEHISYVPVVGNPALILDGSRQFSHAGGDTDVVGGSVFIDTTLANGLGIVDGALLRVDIGEQRSQSVETVRVHTLDAHTRGFADSQLIWGQAAPAAAVGECIVEVAPGVDDGAARELISAGLNNGGSLVISISALLERDPNATTPLERFRNRTTRWLWAVSGVVCWALAFVPLLFRRHEFALLRSVGAGDNPTALVFIMANAFMLLTGHTAGLGWMALAFLWTHRHWPADTGLAAASIAASALLAVALLTVGCVALSRGSIAAFIHRRL